MYLIVQYKFVNGAMYSCYLSFDEMESVFT